MEQNRKICVITGASGGIGQKLVEKFYAHDYNVALTGRNKAALESVAAKLKLDPGHGRCYALDVSDEEGVKEVIGKIENDFKRIDVLVNAAGIVGHYAKTADYGFENFKEIYSVNVFGTFLMMQNVLPVMLRQNSGCIVNIGSVSGMRGYTLEVGYGSSKWAVIGMTQTVANEYGSCGLRVNSVSPGWVDTDMMKRTIDNYRELDEKGAITLGPSGRAAKPSEIADAVYFLCSSEAMHINGANLVVDGGMLLG